MSFMPGFFGSVRELPAPTEHASALDVIRGTDAPRAANVPSYDVIVTNTRERLAAPLSERRELSGAMVARAGLAWNVSEHTAWIRDPATGKGTKVPDHKVLRRDDNGDLLDVVSESYGVIQNADAFAAFDDVVATGGAEYVGAGAFDGGRIVWAQAKLAYSAEILPGDRVVPMVMLRTGHGTDGGALKGSIMIKRLVCLNGATVTEKMGLFSVRHTRRAAERARIAQDTIRQVFATAAKRVEVFKRMTKVLMTREQARAYLLAVMPMPEELAGEERPRARANVERMHAEVSQLMESGRGTELPGVRGTLWGAYNAVTEHVDHVRLRRGDAETQLRNTWFGSGADVKNRAYNVASSLAR